MQPGRRHRKKEVQSRRSTVARLYLQGMSGMEISQKVGVSESQISRDLGIITKAWQESAAQDIAQRKSQDLAELALIKAELWKSWNESKSEKADPRFMSELLKAMRQGAELLGLNEPSKTSLDLNIERILEMSSPEIVDLLYDKIISMQNDE